jgi:hypothetical protein
MKLNHFALPIRIVKFGIEDRFFLSAEIDFFVQNSKDYKLKKLKKIQLSPDPI